MEDTTTLIPEPIDLEQSSMGVPRAAFQYLSQIRFAFWVGVVLGALTFTMGVFRACAPQEAGTHRLVYAVCAIIPIIFVGVSFARCRVDVFPLINAAQEGTPFLYRDRETLLLVEAFNVYRSAKAYNELRERYVAARAAIRAGTRQSFFDERKLLIGLHEWRLVCLKAHVNMLHAYLTRAPLPSQPHVLPALPKRVTLAAFEARVRDLN